MKNNRAGRAVSPAATDGDAESRPEPRARGFPIVGVGASAGGLEAFSALLKHLPLDTGMAFVLVQHLDPEHDSALTQLLSRATPLPVHEVTNNLRVEPNHVYVIPPNRNLGITAGVLTLGPRPRTRAPHRSIDTFFEALAADQRDHAIGVILSGTATDGTLGLEAIKAEGGITFAQDDSARYDSMPRSAVAAGSVDFVLSPEEIADELSRTAKHPAIAGGRGSEATIDRSTEDGFKKILLLLRDHSSVDFSLYKSSTIQRRIIRRMVLTKHETLERYAQSLRGNDKELGALYSDVLISVTSFFRNPEAFEVLRRKVWPALFQQRGGDSLRVWTLGCSTGQEAYSIAMSFVEAADTTPRTRKLQVFATDLNDALLAKARQGLYAKSLAQDLSPERLRRFFVEEEHGYRVSKALRQMVVFARQNVMSDPPFSGLDIISCRNLLIYFEAGLQQKIFPVFHYALKPGGFLYLGASESIGGFTELFEPLDKKFKIYTKKAAPTPAFQLPAAKDRGEPSDVSGRTRGRLQPLADQDGTAAVLRGELTAQREADRVSVNQFAPPAVLIDANLRILQFRGPTGAYLEPPTGKATFDVLKMARAGLMMPLRSVIAKAKKENVTARKEHVRIEKDGEPRTVNIEVIPLKNLQERCFLVVFQDADDARTSAAPARGKRPAARPSSDRAARAAESHRIAALEAELAETRDYLRSLQEQHEAAHEELQASNEEVQSANEELQSINEELETSKEELESTNEELITVNEEMVHRNAELNRLLDDLRRSELAITSARQYAENIIATVREPLVVLDPDLRVESANRAFYRTFAVTPEETIGKFVYELGNRQWAIAELRTLLEEILPESHTIEDFLVEWDFERLGRRSMLLNARRMHGPGSVDGRIVLAIDDITERKQTEQKLRESEQRFAQFMRHLPGLAWIKDADGRYVYANEAAEKAFRTPRPELYGKSDRELFPQETAARFVANDRQALEKSSIQAVESLEDEAGLVHQSIVTKFSMPGASGDALLVGGVAIDITELKETEEALRASEERYRTLFASIDEGFCVLEKVDGPPGAALDFRYVEANPAFAAQTGVSGVVGKTIRQAFPGEPESWFQTYDVILRTGESMRFERGLVTQGRVLELYAFRTEDGDRRRVAVIFKDITERRRVESEVRDSEERYRTLFDLGPVAVYSCDAAGVIQKFNRRAAELWGREPAPGDTNQRFCGSFKMFRPDGRFLPHEQCPMAEVVAGIVGEVRDGEVRIERPDGTQVTVVVNIQPLKNQHGEITGAINCFYDITGRKQAEEALRDSDRRKTEFLAMLAHELRNPLAPILVSIEILRRARGVEGTDSLRRQETVDGLSTINEPNHRIDHALNVLQRQVGQMVRLVDDLLDAGRISRGKIDLRRERVDLSSVVDHVVDAVRPISERRDQELIVTLPSAPVYLDADPTRLGQIIGNLLNNACKFTERGGHIWLSIEREEDSGADRARDASSPGAPRVIIRIRDTGIGIAADHLETVFDMFTQVDTSLERSLTGLGIGLTLVKTLTEMHGGTVDVRSDGIGYGSEFIVRLPIAEGASLPVSTPMATPAVAATPLRVLIVDDNHDSADMLGMLLQFAGHETFAAHDGLSAVDAAAAHDPDVVFLDIGLPVINGYEAARRIREQGGQKRRPLLVALTGWDQEADRRRSQEAGFDAHLVKPVDDAVLGRLLSEFGAGRQEEDRK